MTAAPFLVSAQITGLTDTCSTNVTEACLQQEIQLLIKILTQLLALRNANPSGQVSVSIDTNALVSTSGTPTMTGSASNLSQVYVTLAGNNEFGHSQGNVTVVNGRWSAAIAPLADSSFPAGTYQIAVYGSASDANANRAALTVANLNIVTQVTSGTIAVSSATQPANTIAPQGAVLQFTKFTLTNTGSWPVTIDHVTVQNNNASTDGAFVSVVIDNSAGNSLGGASRADQSGTSLFDATHDLTIPTSITHTPGAVQTLTIAGNVPANLPP